MSSLDSGRWRSLWWHSSLEERLPDAPRWSYARRFWLHWGDDDHRSGESLGAEVYLRAAHPRGIGAAVRFDGPRAETPIDADVCVGRSAVFLSTSTGRRLNQWLRVTSGHSREISFRVDPSGWRRPTNWLIEWLLWVDPEHQVRPTKWVVEREGLSRWYLARRGYVRPVDRLLNHLLGRVDCVTVESDPQDAVAWFEDGPVHVQCRLERRTWKRARSPFSRTRTDGWVTVVAGPAGRYVPTGEQTWGEDDGICGTSTREFTPREAAEPLKWVPVAVAEFTRSVLDNRARYGWRGRYTIEQVHQLNAAAAGGTAEDEQR